MDKLPEYKLELIANSESDKELIGFKYNKEQKNKSKIGGDPDFIQCEDWPVCPHCKKKMAFYGQLDSVGDSVCIADCGMIYVFLCFDCYETKSIVQSY